MILHRDIIHAAMKKIAAIPPPMRKPGHSKLVYDKRKRTIIVVRDNATPALRITAGDAES